MGTAKVPLCCCCRCTAGTLDDRADLVELDDLACEEGEHEKGPGLIEPAAGNGYTGMVKKVSSRLRELPCAIALDHAT